MSRELDAQIARAMGQVVTMRYCEQEPDSGRWIEVESHEARYHLQNLPAHIARLVEKEYGEMQPCVARGEQWDVVELYSTDPATTPLLLAEIARRGKGTDYTAELAEIVGLYSERSYYDWDREWGAAVWALLTADAVQHARAFLATVDSRRQG